MAAFPVSSLPQQCDPIYVDRLGGTHRGCWATLSTLIQSAKMNEVDPLAWLTQTLERIPQVGHRARSTR